MVAVGAAAAQIGQAAPDFALPAAAGSNARLSEYRGEVVLLWFWSSGCSVCAGQLEALDKVYSTYHPAGLEVLGVSVDDNLERARRYALSHKARFPMLLDGAKDVGRAYGIDRLPTAVLIDREGTVRYVFPDYDADDGATLGEFRSLLNDDAALH
jgi:cytochrome c biogenesis protein CcmG/thiol:disulfide interchange protein DsbE